MQTQRQMAANPQTNKPTDLGCESGGRLLPPTSPSPFVIITQLYFTTKCDSKKTE